MMNRSRLIRFFAIALIVTASILVLGYFPFARLRAASSRPTVLRSAGKPLVNLKNPQSVKLTYSGSPESVAALQHGSARPTALAAVDLEANGAVDVVAGYSTATGGTLVVHRGNPDAFAPKDTSLYKKAMQGDVPATFLPNAAVFNIPESPDLIVTGDFNRDGNKDVLVAARGGALYLLAGDGHGNLLTPQVVPLAGQVSAMAATPDGHVAVSMEGAGGARLTILAPSANGLSVAATHELPARGESVEWGNLGGGADLAIATGNSVVVIYNALTASAETETVGLRFRVQAVALGNFIWNRAGSTQIAVLADTGAIHILQHGTLDMRPLTPADIPARRAAFRGHSQHVQQPDPMSLGAWTVAKQLPISVSANAGPVSRSAFNSPRLAASSTQDLMVLDAGRNQLNIFDTSGKTESPSAAVSFAGTPVAALALPQKINAERDIVVLTSAQSEPLIIPAGGDPTFNVNTTTDEDPDAACTNSSVTAASGALSLREAVCLANNTGAGTYTINVPAGTYTLTLSTGGLQTPLPCNDCSPDPWVGETGEIYVGTKPGETISIVGTGLTPADTVITQADGMDRIFEEDVNLGGTDPFSISNVTLSGGNCVHYEAGTPPADCSEGGGVVLAGGFTGDDLTITNVIMSSNTAGGQCTPVPVCGNAGSILTGDGGAILDDGPNLTITGSTFTSNTAVVTGEGGIGDGGAIVFDNTNLNTGTFSVKNSTFGSNVAGLGGAIYAQIGPGGSSDISGSTFTGNKAQGTSPGGFGGAIYFGGEVAGEPLTVSNSRIVSNAASNAGSGVVVEPDAANPTPATTATLVDNWWGCNAGPGGSGCDAVLTGGTGATANFTPWLVLGISAASSPIMTGGTSDLTATLTAAGTCLGGYTDNACYVPDGTPVTFGGTLGASSPTSSTFTSGSATSTFTAGGTGGPGAGTATVDNQTVSAPITITASTVQITIATNPASLLVSVDGGAFMSAPLVESWVVGSSHTIATTSPQSGGAGVQYVFSAWSDVGAISHSIMVPATATTYTATFNTQYQLTTQASPSPDGTVSPASGGFYISGAIIPVTATANAGYQFSSWSSTGGSFGSNTAASTNFTMPGAPATVTGNFAAVIPQYQLTTAANPPGGGTVSPATATLYNAGTIVPISAIAAPGYLFVNWSSTADPVANSTSAFTSIQINSAESVTANFKAVTFTESWLKDFASPALGGPSARFSAAAANDSNGNMLLFGGSNGTSLLGDTWVWTGDEWVAIAGTNPDLSARWEAGTAFDGVRQKTVMFGGNSAVSGPPSPLGDTWIWDGLNWNSVSPAQSPTARVATAMAFDQLHGVTVLFGGNTGSASADDTWLWDGTTWTNAGVAPANSPLVRSGASMVYDAAHGQILLFGGQDGSTFYNDTWVWNGTAWSQLSPGPSPGARSGAAMAFDAQHARVVLMGGTNGGGALNDTWYWDGAHWTQVSPPGPSARYGSSMVFTAVAAGASAGGQIFMFGGTDGTSVFSDAWIFDAPAATTSTLGTAYFDVPYDYTIPVVGGVGPYTFTQDGAPYSLTSFGLNLNSTTGEITGTNQAAAGMNIPIGITITDSQGFTTDVVFDLPVDNAVTLQPASLPAAIMGTNYFVQLSASSGTGPYAFTATGLPNGLSLNGSNQIVGLCTASSTNVILSVTDSQTPSPATTTEGPLTLSCNAAPVLGVSKSHTGNFTQGQTAVWNISVSNTATGSTTSGTVTVSDTLPSGFTLSSYTGAGWTCAGTGTVTCNSTQAISGGSGFPTIALTVNVPATSPVTVTNTVDAYGGGDLNHTSLGSAVSNLDTATVVQVPASISINGSGTQSTNVNTAFGSLAITVKDAGGVPIANYPSVVFTATPGGSGQSGTFSNSTGTTTAPANGSGIANPGTFTANGIAGSYTVGVAAGSARATFNLTNIQPVFLLTTAANPATGGTVSPATGNQNANAVVPITATPKPGFIFSNWSGSAVTNANSASTTVKMTAAESVTANFISALSVSPTTYNFGTVYLGTITTKIFTVTNNSAAGTAPISVTGPFISIVKGGNSNEFVEVNECGKTLAAGAHCTVSVSFVAGPYYTAQTATLSIMTSNAAANPAPVMLSALVIDPQASFKPTSLNFGTISFGKSSAPQTVTLTNTGAGSVPLNITSIGVTGTNAANFVANSSACPASLAPGAHCSITITFAPPKNSGSYSANLTVKDNAQSATQTVSLTGKGSH